MANTERIDRQIQELEEKLRQERAQLDRLKARKVQESRKADTRRKILVGAVVVARAKHDPEFYARLLTWLDEGLTAPRDRALFDFSAAAQGEQKTGTFSAPANDDLGVAEAG